MVKEIRLKKLRFGWVLVRPGGKMVEPLRMDFSIPSHDSKEKAQRVADVYSKMEGKSE